VVGDIDRISANHKSSIWEYLEILVDNCQCEAELLEENTFA